MFNKVLEKYSQLKSEHNLLQQEDNKAILKLDEEVLIRFLELYDKDVKKIHTNQEIIDKDLQFLFKETEKLSNITKQAVTVYDGFLEYLKEAGDLVNWCSILDKEMAEIHDSIASRHNEKHLNSNSEFQQEL